MKRTSKRVWAGLVALAVAALTVPILSTPAASAAGVLQPGPVQIKNAGGAALLSSGNSGTTFTLRLPSGAACGGDSANDGYRVQSFIVPVTVDPASLTFNASGPIPAGVGASLRQPLFDTTGTPYVNAQTANATAPPGPGPIVNIPDFNFAVFSPGNIPAGQYHVGIACTLGPASATQMKEFWDVRMTFTTPGGGPAAVNWVAGTPAPNGCKSSTTAAAEIGHYPANPGSQSSLRVSCTLNNNPGTSQVASKFRVKDFPNAQYHNGAARTINATANVPIGATTFTAANCAGMTGYVNRGITTPPGVLGIPPRTFVKSISGACLVTLSNPTTAAIVAPATNLKVDNVNGPRSRVDATFTAASTTVTSPTANFLASDVGLSVEATEAVPGTTIAAVVNPTTATLSIAASASAVGNGVLTIGGATRSSSTRQFNDGAITNATTLNSPAAARFNATDIGLKVTGPGIPANTFITAVPSAANATTTGGMTVTAGPQTYVVGDPSATAPNGIEQVAILGVQLDLSSTLVAGSEDCALENAEGFATVARWRNPGDFGGAPLFNTQPANTKAIGQIYFDTAVTDFSAFVVETNTPLGPGTFSYDLVFPSLPVTSAMCPGTQTSPGIGLSLGVGAQQIAIATLATGTGRPGTAQVRAIIPSAFSGGFQQGYATAASVVSDDPAVTFSPASEFTRTCVYPVGAVQVNFKCGNG